MKLFTGSKAFLAIFLLAFPISAQAGTCKDAIDKAIREHGQKWEIMSTNFTRVGGENMVEVTTLVLTWWPKSETRSEWFFLISATCNAKGENYSDLGSLELYNEMPGEGGVTVKTVTKARM